MEEIESLIKEKLIVQLWERMWDKRTGACGSELREGKRQRLGAKRELLELHESGCGTDFNCQRKRNLLLWVVWRAQESGTERGRSRGYERGSFLGKETAEVWCHTFQLWVPGKVRGTQTWYWRGEGEARERERGEERGTVRYRRLNFGLLLTLPSRSPFQGRLRALQSAIPDSHRTAVC